MRRVGFLVFSGMLAVQQITQVTAIAQDQKFTCQVYGGSSVWMTPTFRRWLASR